MPAFHRLALPLRALRGPLLRFSFAACLAGAASIFAEPLSKKIDVDFFRDVPSRNLRGLATRSDGRLVAGPVLTELDGTAPADLLWCLTPSADNKWLIGSGPDGRIFEATLDFAKKSFATRELAKLDEPHVFALRRLNDGAILAGTSPHGVVVLIRDGKVTARAALPVDSIFDLLLLPHSTTAASPQALLATGNPARIYRVDLAKFAAAGVAADKLTTPEQLAAHGFTLFGEIRDRNLRRLALFADGRIAAGSAPKGNIYTFPSAGGAPTILQENRDAEVTDLLPQPNGDLYATLVFTITPGDSRINSGLKSKDPLKEADSMLAALTAASMPEKFSGRSSVVWFPAGGFPETLTARGNVAFYQLARHGDTLLVAGGEQGELIGYDLATRFSLTFAGSTSSQLNALAPIPGAAGKFLLLRNNSAGLALLDFNAPAERSAETRRLDLGTPATLGALRFSRLRNLATSQLALEIKTSFGSDELEGWSSWTPLTATSPDDAAWSAENLRGRYAKLRLTFSENGGVVSPTRTDSTRVSNASSATTTSATPSLSAPELDKAELYFLPQNRRPVLQEFRLLPPNIAIIPASESAPSVTTSLSQLLAGGKDDDSGPKRGKGAFLSSQIVPAPGTQVALWTLNDPDGDNLAATFSIRREDQTAWTDIAIATHEPYGQFETSRLSDGVYFTRLVATELAPRAASDRLSVTFETDNLIVDHTPPTVLEATATRTAENLTITLHGRDALSLLDGVDIALNNGFHEIVDDPVDGIRDSREETFTLEIPLVKTAGATAAEVSLYDDAGNATTRRITW